MGAVPVRHGGRRTNEVMRKMREILDEDGRKS